MADTYRITRQYEETRPNDAGRFVAMHVTKFVVGDDGPFEVACPVDGFDPAVNVEKIQQRADQVVAARRAVNG